jgi:hypothetical protein
MSTLLTRAEAIEFLRRNGFPGLTTGFFNRVCAPGRRGLNSSPPFVQVREGGRPHMYRQDALLQWARENVIPALFTLRDAAPPNRRRPNRKQRSARVAA